MVNNAQLNLRNLTRLGLMVTAIVLVASFIISVRAYQGLSDAADDVQNSYTGLLKLEDIFNEEVSGARKLILDNPIQKDRVDEFESLIKERIDLMRVSVELRAKYGFEEAQKLSLTDKGRTIMGYL